MAVDPHRKHPLQATVRLPRTTRFTLRRCLNWLCNNTNDPPGIQAIIPCASILFLPTVCQSLAVRTLLTAQRLCLVSPHRLDRRDQNPGECRPEVTRNAICDITQPSRQVVQPCPACIGTLAALITHHTLQPHLVVLSLLKIRLVTPQFSDTESCCPYCIGKSAKMSSRIPCPRRHREL